MFPALHQPASTIALFTSLASICLAAAPPKPIAPAVGSLKIPQVGTTFSEIDARFEVRPIFWGPKIQSIACLMNAVNAMTNMAIQDIRAPMGETTYQHADHPNSFITLLPQNWQQRGQIERLFAVWGLFLAAYTMTTTGNYHCNTFHLVWDGKEVGTLGFSRGVIMQSPSSAPNASDQGLLSLNHTTTPLLLSTSSTSDFPHLGVSIKFLPAVTPIQNFFMIVLGALTELANFQNKNTGIEYFAPDPAPIPAFVAFFAWETNRVSLMTARHIIETLAHVPALMLARGKFSEANVVLKLDGVEAGFGRFRNIDARIGFVQGRQNVTVA